MPSRCKDPTAVQRGSRAECVRCQIPICTQCKGRADDLAHSEPDVPCTRPDVHSTAELQLLMRQAGYKQWFVFPRVALRAENSAGQ